MENEYLYNYLFCKKKYDGSHDLAKIEIHQKNYLLTVKQTFLKRCF